MELKLKDNEKFKRKYKMSFTLNEYEYNALIRYCHKYKIENKAKFMREAVISRILEHFDSDYPTLFEKKDMENGKYDPTYETIIAESKTEYKTD